MVWKKRGEFGIGTLILFIAMLIVAAIAAGVLIQTSQSLQSKALMVGEKVTQQISTAVYVINVVGENGTENYLTDFFYEIKLSGGSDAFDFNNALLSLETANNTLDLRYRAGTCTKTSGYITYGDGTGYFTVEYLQSGTNHREGYMVRGDVARLCFMSLDGVQPDQEASIVFKPAAGFEKRTAFVVDSVLLGQRVHLYP